MKSFVSLRAVPGPQNKNAMTPATPAPQRGIAAIGPAVVPLLAIAVFINYVDRGNMATAAPLIKDQLHLSSTQIGLLLSAFFWSYVPAQILAGWLAEHVNPYRTLAIGLAFWSIVTAASGLTSGFYTLIALRVLLARHLMVAAVSRKVAWPFGRANGQDRRPHLPDLRCQFLFSGPAVRSMGSRRRQR